ncbi:hypothetical protein AGLY_012965 [Aphis glycines]|uniref:Uncharacterized protein n=1 Tax=Aphis glycines TaxID=307491 RepID=A0A6G0T7D1_APHGL|nr:hypothetical protein AGLY_012965 [Aphis glycines]
MINDSIKSSSNLSSNKSLGSNKSILLISTSLRNKILNSNILVLKTITLVSLRFEFSNITLLFTAVGHIIMSYNMSFMKKTENIYDKSLLTNDNDYHKITGVVQELLKIIEVSYNCCLNSVLEFLTLIEQSMMDLNEFFKKTSHRYIKKNHITFSHIANSKAPRLQHTSFLAYIKIKKMS